MAVDTRTDADVLFLAGLAIIVSQQGATTMIALEGEWDLAQREKDAFRRAKRPRAPPRPSGT